MDEDDRGASGLHVADDQPPLHGRQALQGVALFGVPVLVLDQAEGVHRDVRGQPGRLFDDSAHALGTEQ